jgi:tyrosyl-tRNA synthetase
MTQSQTQDLSVLKRGVAQVLPDSKSLAAKLAQGKIRVYLGIDPTGNLLTLGHSVVLRKLQQFADLGHEVILLIGNGTVRIGDPTGRDQARPTLTDEQIKKNFETWKEQASKVLDFSKIEIRYNGDWLDKLTYSDIINLMAQTTAQQLLERDMFQERMKKKLPIYGHELLYPLLQGYDSVVMDVDLEIGGTDQTFNMMVGRQLQRQLKNREKWVLTTPIINGTDGRKMSKSYGNFIALIDEPSDMYGKLMSIADEMIIEYFTVLTDVSEDEIAQMEKAIAAGENPMEFKKKLAFTITKMYHNEKAAQEAEKFFQKTVQNNEIPENVPSVKVDKDETLISVLKKAFPDESNTQLRRLIDQSAVELLPSGERPTDPFFVVDATQNKTIRLGKRRYVTLGA